MEAQEVSAQDITGIKLGNTRGKFSHPCVYSSQEGQQDFNWKVTKYDKLEVFCSPESQEKLYMYFGKYMFLFLYPK